MNRVPKRLSTLCVWIEGQNGFEAYRLINMEEDPMLDNAGMQLKAEINKLGQVRCKNVMETKRLIEISDAKKEEFTFQVWLKWVPDQVLNILTQGVLQNYYTVKLEMFATINFRVLRIYFKLFNFVLFQYSS